MTLTERKIASMLQENTGRHMLDSGGAYGRNWEHNQGRDFSKEDPCTLDGRCGLEVTHNLYHWLSERLDYNPDLQRQFTRFCNREENREDSWFANLDAFMEERQARAKRRGEDFGGIYGEGDPVVVNTYNHESLLSQVIQYVYWEDNSGGHVFLMIHGGCDVRGGYTKPVAFDVDGNLGELTIFDDARAGIYCRNEKAVADQLCLDGSVTSGSCEASWYTDDGYHWYASNGEGDLDKFELVQHDAELEDGSEPKPGDGYIYVDEDGIPHCPFCGSRLAASFY
jgi:hypothetical protein